MSRAFHFVQTPDYGLLVFWNCYKGSWRRENLAGYGRFRYYIWAADDTAREVNPLWDLDSAKAGDRGYKPYGPCELFFACMDAKYPTTRRGDGLIDSIHQAIRNGEVTRCGGTCQRKPSCRFFRTRFRCVFWL